MIVGTKMKLVRFEENEDTWQNDTEEEVHKRREAEAPREKRKPETCMCGGKEGHTKRQIVNSRVRHVPLAAKLVT